MASNATMPKPRELLRGLFDVACAAAPGLGSEWLSRLHDHSELF